MNETYSIPIAQFIKIKAMTHSFFEGLRKMKFWTEIFFMTLIQNGEITLGYRDNYFQTL